MYYCKLHSNLTLVIECNFTSNLITIILIINRLPLLRTACSRFLGFHLLPDKWIHSPLWTCCIAPLPKTLKNAKESLHFDECMTLVPSTGCNEAGNKHFLTLAFTKTSPINGLYLRIKLKLHVYSFFFRGNIRNWDWKIIVILQKAS